MSRVLLVGAGGREHALAWKLEQSPLVEHIYVIPGNGGTAGLSSKVSNVSTFSADTFSEVLAFAVKQDINLLVPGPEAPLVAGITDYFRQHGPASIQVFGPSKAAARMEGSKAFSKDFMKRHGIPTAAYENFTSYDEAQQWLDEHKSMKIVIKASGLAAGKGVIIPISYEEACNSLRSIMLDKEFGAAGDTVVLEEFLEGEELSVLSFSDGYTIRSLPAAQDHKTVGEGDTGLNTGGMGCYAPTSIATQALMAQMHSEALQPTIDGMRKERMPFVGCLFTGFMITKTGPKVLEYNVRFGDPETQTLLPLLETDLAEIMLASTSGYLSSIDLKLKPSYSTCVVVAAGGYPGKYGKGDVITVTKPAEDIFIFHAGTAHDQGSGSVSTAGGRVIAATAIGSSITAAAEKAYTGVSCIKFDRMYYRKDIAHRELKRAKMSTNGISSANGGSQDIPLTYAGAGVSVALGNSLVERIKASVKSTAQPWAPADIGGFGGEISLAEAGFPKSSPTIVAAIDGIGTKIMVAQAVGNHSTVGIDLVAMNTNDLLVQGAKPLAFLDYYACNNLDVDACESFVAGVAEGCKQSLCALVGGETAEMPGIYKKGDYDGAGCAIGALAQGKTLLPAKSEMRAGDRLLGIASSGCHSNGFSLIRKIVQRAGLAYSDPAPWEQATNAASRRTVGDSLLEPTRIYVKSILSVLDASGDAPIPMIKGMAHITGGGLTENIPRAIPRSLSASVDVASYPVPPVFAWLKKAGALDNHEFARTFNTGLGMVCVVAAENAERVKTMLEEHGEIVYQIGELVERNSTPNSGDEGCILRGLESWDQF